MDSNQIALICKFLWSFVWTTPLCKNAQTISWCQWVWDGGGENDCHLCCYVSCTFLHLTADCDGWEKTDPGDSLDAEEGEGWRHVCPMCHFKVVNKRLSKYTKWDCLQHCSFHKTTSCCQAFNFGKVKVVCFFEQYKYFTWWKYGREKRERDEVRLWLVAQACAGHRYWFQVTLWDASLLENSFPACTRPLTAPRARTSSLDRYIAHWAKTTL